MRRALSGLMIGTMAGAGMAMCLHTLLTLQPSLATGPLGDMVASLAAPGARLIALVSPRWGSHELGMLSHWISLQFTLLLLGAGVGAGVAIVTGKRRAPPPSTTPPR